MTRAVIVPQIDQMAALSQAGTNRSDKDERGEDEAEGELVSLFVRSIMLCLPAAYRLNNLIWGSVGAKQLGLRVSEQRNNAPSCLAPTF